MAVLCESEMGWVIDHSAYIRRSYTGCPIPNRLKDEPAHGNIEMVPDLFDIKEPFWMDSQFQKLQEAMNASGSDESTKAIFKKVV